MRYINDHNLKALIYILKLAMDNMEVQIFFTIVSIKIKKRNKDIKMFWTNNTILY